ncbi:iron-sulfur cluster carrier protein ApbC [Hydrocarboniclastica marina]|uniref:Iron-sulfur cluster carrier protein n=1 Tax=Hydrocarboniclastica marina TaxID=2259620 RepID=A0A4V1D8U0_9ALTE|nr:iron-sulfur cluster carrier protein ApbC [Hydrocarboniclastica marina]MAL98918.1 iron-sulfur cluster carrier protein ApbC [Alteromonadaceae bacterium]QCF26360.1 iron-sulfur cluster carrier protein ApbC [Hydrocarboniclastica marina]|tara:strand:- start:723 stop:1820 length:1098 start_codon:yes stop_codon:yes gene_type:complete
MSAIDRNAIEAAIRTYQDPYLHQDLLSLDAVKRLDIDGSTVTVDVELGYPCEGILGGMKQVLTTVIENVPGVETVNVSARQKIRTHQAQGELQSLGNVRNIVAVASGKGGVGKSTTAVNLALALAKEGARTGILDADIYGPSVGMMLGIPENTRPQTKQDKYFVPVEAHGVQAMSMAFLVTDKTPMVWRGPMVSGALQQLLNQTLWDDLDYLVVDMPPGTGDIQLTLAQKVPVTGAVIVTTPQDIALLDCKKGIEMFRKVDIPVLGVVENMSTHICSNCGHHEALFGTGGGERVANEYGTELLGQLPLHMTIREQTDSGRPTVINEPDSEVAMLYRDIARRVGASLSRRDRNLHAPIPSISISDD